MRKFGMHQEIGFVYIYFPVIARSVFTENHTNFTKKIFLPKAINLYLIVFIRDISVIPRLTTIKK